MALRKCTCLATLEPEWTVLVPDPECPAHTVAEAVVEAWIELGEN